MEKKFLELIGNQIIGAIFMGYKYIDPQTGYQNSQEPQISYLLPDIIKGVSGKVVEEFFKKVDMEELKEKIIENVKDKLVGEGSCQNYPYSVKEELQKLYGEIGRMEIDLLRERKKELESEKNPEKQEAV